MKYPQRDKDGKIVGFATHPNEITDKDPVDEKSQEWKDYVSKSSEPNYFLGMNKTEYNKFIDLLKSGSVISASKASKLKVK